MKLTKLFKKARLGKRRKGEVSDMDMEASVPRRRPVAVPAASTPLASSTPHPLRSMTVPARRHTMQQQAAAVQPTHEAVAPRVVPSQLPAPSPRSLPVAPQKSAASKQPVKSPAKKPAVFHDIMPPRGAQRSRGASFTKPSVKPQPPKHALSPSRASLIKPVASAPAPAKRPLNKLSSVKAQPVKPLSSHPSHPPLTKPPLSSQTSTRPLNPVAAASSRRPNQPSVTVPQAVSKPTTSRPHTSPRASTPHTDTQSTTKRLLSQPHQLPTQPKLPPQPKELTHPQATAHSRAHIAVPSRRPQLTHRPPHIRAMDMVHK